MTPQHVMAFVVGARGNLRASSQFIALGAFSVLLIVAGKNPWQAYTDTIVYVFGNAYGFSELLVRMTPLLFTAVAVALPARIGLINVGGEGQLYMGAWLATAGELALQDHSAFVLLPALTVLGFVGGGLWALLPAILRALRLVNETISTLLLNYVAPLIVSYFIFGPWRSPESSSYPQSPAFVDAARLPTFFHSRVHARPALRAGMPRALLAGDDAHALWFGDARDRRQSGSGKPPWHPGIWLYPDR